MGNVLAFCEVSGSSLRTNALSCIAFARQAAEKHGGQVVVLLAGKGVKEAAADAAKYAPKVVVVDDARLEQVLAETFAPVIARVAKAEQASVICATATSVGKDVMPRVAALVGAGMASDIAAIVDKNRFRRAILAGNAFQTVEVSSDPIVVTARQSEFDPAAPAASAGTVTEAEAGDVKDLGAEVVRVAHSRQVETWPCIDTTKGNGACRRSLMKSPSRRYARLRGVLNSRCPYGWSLSSSSMSAPALLAREQCTTTSETNFISQDDAASRLGEEILAHYRHTEQETAERFTLTAVL